MEFLFDNPLANLPGQLFLMLYATVIAAAIITFQIFKRRFDTTQQTTLPPIPSNPDAHEIAFLRGGSNELVRSVIFALNRKGFLQVDTDLKNKSAIIRQTATKPAKHELNSLEQKVYKWFAVEQTPKNIFAKNGLTSELELFAATYEQNLRKHNLLTGADVQSRVTRFKWKLFACVAALGSYKLLAALAHERYNIGFLELMTVAALVTFALMNNLPRISALGKLYLERLQLAFDRLKSPPQINQVMPSAIVQTSVARKATAFSAVDPMLLAVGVFGLGALTGTPYDNYHQAFHRAQQQQAGAGAASSCGSGCGSTWDSSSSGGGSSCSSSDGGGGSCGGGSCGGGGCGGGGCGG